MDNVCWGTGAEWFSGLSTGIGVPEGKPRALSENQLVVLFGSSSMYGSRKDKARKEVHKKALPDERPLPARPTQHS